MAGRKKNKDRRGGVRLPHMEQAKESAEAKSTGLQKEDKLSAADGALFSVLSTGKKIPKSKANYSKSAGSDAYGDRSCEKCKFNLGDEEKCHIVEGRIDNERGTSKFFSPKGDGMLPGDIVWLFVKKTGRKLGWNEGYVIGRGAEGYQCRDCKYYLYSGSCLLIKGTFRPEMSCGFIVKVGNGIEV